MNKRKKKNKYLPLILLLAIVAVLAAAYGMLASSNARKEAELAAEAAAESAVEMIAEYDYTTLTALTYTRAGSEPVSMRVVEGMWQLTEDGHFPVNQSIPAAMASAISSIGISNHITEGDPADYGLAEPAYTIEVTYADGTSHQYRIGDYNSFGGGAYYFMMDGMMYTIPTGLTSYFDYDTEDLLQLDSMPTDIDPEYINSVTLVRDGMETVIDGEEETAELFELFRGITLTECADYYTDEAERTEAYGLDGSGKIVISYKRAVTTADENGVETTNRLDTSYTFLIGGETGEGTYYGSPEKSTIAYSIDPEIVTKIFAYAE